MSNRFNPKKNYEKTKKEAGFVSRKEANQSDYDRIGFMSGLEVHQQLKTDEKLFCRCPSGKFYNGTDFDAEVIRHMRPTLSELGEYDGTALMEFKTRKNIKYKLRKETACTYEVDDTPPFPINRSALDIAIQISLLSKLNIVGEVHVTRKQYLDGSIPTGFQRTAIIGVEGEIPLKHKKIRLIQLSIEEDSCRELLDVGHLRVYNTDRLGMPLIETVTYPEMVNPDEVKEACDYIRFLNRSTGNVRTGMGAGRQDVNVSCRGGSRVEIKGVAHTKWIPELTHIECFRQWSLLLLKDKLKKQISDTENWKSEAAELNFYEYGFAHDAMIEAKKNNQHFFAVNLPGFKSALSHFTQPGHMFANEIMDRLKVIACLERPNMTHSEELDPWISNKDLERIRNVFNASEEDAQIIFWAPAEDVETAKETIEERCQMAFDGIPEETRKSFADGTTIFERVLPGADRMYPDTDTVPIPLEEEEIEDIRRTLPNDVIDRYYQLMKWNVPEDTHHFIFSRNLYSVIEKIVNELNYAPKFMGTFFGHYLKYIEGQHQQAPGFDYNIIYGLFKFLKKSKLEKELAYNMLPVVYQYPSMEFESILTVIKFKPIEAKEILSKIPFLVDKWNETKRKDCESNQINWIIGQLRPVAVGNIDMNTLLTKIREKCCSKQEVSPNQNRS